MSTKLFNKLVQELCDMHKLDASDILAGGAIEMADISFCLLHDNEADSPLLTVCCDLGIVPKHLEAQAYKKLLETNLSSYTGQGETFCLAPEGHVVLLNSYLLESITVDLLTGFLAMTAIVAKDWQENYFLEKNAPSTKSRNSGLFLNKNTSKKK